MHWVTRSLYEPRRGKAALGEVGISSICGTFGISIFGGGGGGGGGGRIFGGGDVRSCAFAICAAGTPAAIDSIRTATTARFFMPKISASHPLRTSPYSSGASSIGSNRVASSPKRFH